MVQPLKLVAGAVRQPIPYGVFSVIDFRPEDDSRWLNGVEFEHVPCGVGGFISMNYCDENGNPITPEERTPADGNVRGEATAFGVYGSYKCTPIGTGFAEGQERAEEHLLAYEQTLVETQLERLLVAEDDKVDFGTLKGARALGLLEEHLAKTYGALGVLHMNRATATLLEGFLEFKGRTALTKLGTPVLIGSGYTGAADPANPVPLGEETEYRVYATPALFGYRSEVRQVGNQPGDLFDRGTNDFYAYAERYYLIGKDSCPVGVASISTQ